MAIMGVSRDDIRISHFIDIQDDKKLVSWTSSLPA